ncbi:uncharacterized protein TNCV_876801 [Trichonephila clavipes]|nr:uncharacterized protein TNCV_876801 [Trichonephila clavipes]
MNFYKPTSLGLFQLLIASVLVVIYTNPGDAMMNHGPMIIFKAGKGHGHGGGMGAMGLLAAGLAFKLISELGKHHHHHGGGHEGGGGYGHGMGGGAGYGGAHSFAGHDAHLPMYGYEPQEHPVWRR